MTEKRGTAFRRAARIFASVALLSLGASGLWAQGTTGKVQGTVLDPTGQPVANAQVFVLGTSFAAMTNEDGFYFINNVPAGMYSMRAQFIGYQPAQIENVRVLSDQTLSVEFRLSGAVALEAITITAAQAPIVPRDQVASRSIVTGEDIDALPVNDALSVIQLQPGVVSGRGGAISIRGSRANEAVIFVDGAPVRRMDTGSTILSLATNQLQEVSVTTGAMDAAFGDAQAGVISFVTRSGGPTFRGTFAYEGDEFMGKSLTTGFNRFEAALSGPVFGNLTFALGGTATGDRGTAFGGGAVTGRGEHELPSYTFAGLDTTVTLPVTGSPTDSTQYGIPRIIQYGGECEPMDLNGNGSIDAGTVEDNFGFECQGRLRPYVWNTDVRANAKLQMTYGSGSRISLTGLTNMNQDMRPTSMNIEGATGNYTLSNMAVLNWVQQVFRGAESELAVDLNLSYQTDRSLNGAVVRGTDYDLRNPALGIVLSPIDFITGFESFSRDTVGQYDNLTGGGRHVVTQLTARDDWRNIIENVRYDQGSLRSFLNRLDVNTASTQRVNAWGLTATATNVGTNFGQGFRYEERLVGRFNVDYQADRYNRFKLGAEATRGFVGRYEMSWTNKSFGNGYIGEPLKMAAYLQDRLDLGDVVLEFGMRYDQFNAGTEFTYVPGRTFNNPAFDKTMTVEQMTCMAPTDCDPATNASVLDTYVWRESQTHTALSPRVRVSFPVTDRTGFRLSYAHQVQAPDLFNMYNGTNNDLANTNTNDQFGGDADFGKTIIFEFGIRHAFSPDMVLDIAAYNKDKVSDITYRILPFYDPFSERISNVNVLTNADFGNVRGMDVQLIRRFGNIFASQVSYTFQTAKSTGSDPTDFLNGLSRAPFGVTGERPEPPQTTLRTRDDRRHNIQGTFTVNFPRDYAPGSALGSLLRGVGLFGTFQVRSGLPYTRLQNYGSGNRSSGGFGLISDLTEPLQSSETPWERYFDLRVTKGFRLGPTDWTLYADLRNPFNFENRTVVFSETGDVVNEEYLATAFLDPSLLTMQQEAQLSNVWTQIRKGEGAEQRIVGAMDLRADGTCANWKGGTRTTGCVMLQRAEQRFGNGDGIYDVEEQTAAITDLYNTGNSPAALLAAGRVIRIGVQLQF